MPHTQANLLPSGMQDAVLLPVLEQDATSSLTGMGGGDLVPCLGQQSVLGQPWKSTADDKEGSLLLQALLKIRFISRDLSIREGK